jgi:serine protease AprX
MSRRTLMVALVALATFFSLTLPAGAAPLSHSPGTAGPPPHADLDGDGLSEALEARLQRVGAAEKVDVIVTWAGRPDLAAARAAAGQFAVLEEFAVIDGFRASMTRGQVRALAGVAGVFRIDENFEVQATNFETDQEFGSERARVEFGVDGTGVDVCVIDTGADPNHEQLDSNIVGFFDAINGRTAPYDDQGHGTHVAATIAGDGVGSSPDAARYQGVAPGASLHIAKVLSSSGSGTATQIINGIDWCIERGADVLSASLGTSTGSDGLDALSQAVNNAVTNHGMVATIAAGNSGDAPRTVGSPGAAEHALTVGASGKMSDGLVLAPFSSRGPNLSGILKPEVVAPGVSVISADAGTTSGYVSGSGTSMATPFTAGAVALLLDANPSLNPAEVKNLVTATARDIGVPGADNDSGYGLIDGYGLLSTALGSPAAGFLPTHGRVPGTVANSGLWSHPITVSGGDVGQPIGVTILIEGSLQCSAWFFGICLGYEWSPDLDARLVAPDGTVVNSRCPLEGFCGTAGVQETFRVVSALEGTYTLEVYPYDGSPNNGKGGSFGVDIFTGASGAAPANQPPVADAGPDQTVPDTDGLPGESVTLDGSGSSDPDGTIVSYSWVSGGTQIATGVNPTVVLGDGTQTVTLTVTDDGGASAADDVVITVGAPAAANQPPVADAGPDQTVPDTDGLPGESVTLDGSASSDPDGTIVSYSWSWSNGSATGVSPTVDLADGTHTVTLIVTDDEGETASDTVTVTVQPPPTAPGGIHVHDLDDLSEKLARGAWKGVVDVAVRDSLEGVVTGFTVTGTFSQGSWSGTFTCTDGGSGDTDGLANGICRFDSGPLPSKDGKATFMVTGVTLSGYTYESAANHDSDGDSDGTTIQLSK